MYIESAKRNRFALLCAFLHRHIPLFLLIECQQGQGGVFMQTQGLTTKQAEESRRLHGSNALTRRKGQSFFRHFLANFGDPIIRILLIALAVNVVLLFRQSDWYESAGIALAVLVATLVSTLSERGSN